MFGDKFYPTLNKLNPWKQSLFALCLTQRQFANYILWAKLTGREQGIGLFNHALTVLWHFHQDKFNHIDLTAELTACEAAFPLQSGRGGAGTDEAGADAEEDLNIGDLCALNAAHSLRAAFEAVTLHEGDEAEKASKSSLSSVLLSLRSWDADLEEDDKEFDELSDEEIRELPPVDEEVNFQVSLLELLLKGTRGPQLLQLLLKTSLKDGCSNIGLTLEEDELQLCSIKRYLLSSQSSPYGAKPGHKSPAGPKAALKAGQKSGSTAPQAKRSRGGQKPGRSSSPWKKGGR